MPLACNARRRASMMPKLGAGSGGAQQPGSSSYESMMEAAGGAPPMDAPQPQVQVQVHSSTRSSKSQQQHRIGVSPYGAAARLDMDGGMTPAERKAALLKKRQSLAVMSRFSHTGGRGISYSGLSSADAISNNEENQPPAAAGAPAGARGALKPRPAGVNVVPAAVTTNIVKPTTGIYAAAEQQQGQAQAPQQLDAKRASMLLKQLRATVGRAEQAGKRLQVLAQAQRGSGGIRPSQEVLSLSSRLQAANTAALDALGTLFPPELFPLPPSSEEEGESAPAAAEPEQEQPEPQPEDQEQGGDKAAASLLSVVAEEGEGKGQEEGGEVEAALAEMVEEVEAQLSQVDAAEAPAEGTTATKEQAAQAQEGDADEEETVAVEEEQEAEAAAEPEQGAALGVGGPESPPSMSDLGLSAFTRRFILEGAKQPSSSPVTTAKPAAGAAGAGVKGLSPTLSASPASPPLPIEKRAAAAAMGVLPPPPGTPVITMPTADGERAFPSPVFRTGVKLRHPPTIEGGRGAHHDAQAPHSAGSSTSTNSSSLPSPALFEPKSVDRHGARHSLHAPGQQPQPQQQHHPFLTTTTTTKPPPGSVLKQHDASFASSSAPTPGLASPALRRTRLQQQLVAAVPTAAAAGTDGSDDPTPGLSSPVALATAVAAVAGSNETPSTARCIRLLQFPPSGGGARTVAAAAAAAAAPPTGSATRARKTMGRTPLAGGQDPNESMTYNYPDLTTHSTSFCFSPKGLGLEAEPPNPNPSSTPPQPPVAAASSGGRYLLRSAEKARELALAKQREEEEAAVCTAVPTPSRQRVVSASGVVSAGKGSARRSPRLAARSQALAAANNRRVSMTGGPVPPSPVASARKSPRIAAKARGAGSRLFGEEDEVEGAGGVVPIAEVGEAEYGKTPSFIRIQVTRDMLNGAIAAINAHVAAAGPQLEPLERVLGVVAQGDASKTLLLSLVHLKRVEIVVDARGQKAYKLWR